MTTNEKIRTVALIVAAGKGERFGDTLPKQYAHLNGRSVLYWTVSNFLNHPDIDSVQVVIHPDHADLYQRAVMGLPLPKPVTGGGTRQDSVRAGLESLSGLSPETVLIHDGARPLVDAQTISRVCGALETHDAAIAALPLTDTLKQADKGGMIDRTVPRDGLWRAQTPQGFRYQSILEGHRKIANENTVTDDAGICEISGIAVELVMGNTENIKITHKEDLLMAERLMMSRLGDIRTGFGFDVHAFDTDAVANNIRLCGVDVPFDKKLTGHSDADVGLHAVADAIYGAIGKGDIGSNFPPSDPQWKGADSAIFLEHAANEVAMAGGLIAHVDLTLVCEAPKIGPHRKEMVERISAILGLEPGRASVKATTTEKLGFTGRSEGIAAQAIVTLRLPIHS